MITSIYRVRRVILLRNDTDHKQYMQQVRLGAEPARIPGAPSSPCSHAPCRDLDSESIEQ